MSHYDPSQTISSEFGIFGIPVKEEEAKLILLPVPWEVTTSYGKGASHGPQIIRHASEQIDLFDLETGKAYESGYFMREISSELENKNKIMKAKAQELIHMKTEMVDNPVLEKKLTSEVNQACEEMTEWVYQQSKQILDQKKFLGLVGGDHSTPLGAIRAVSEKVQGNFGVLHIDAHADLRNAYQGFKQSHASIMYNVMNSAFKPKKLVQVGIRDFSEDEYNLIQERSKDIRTFFDIDNKRRQLEGITWAKICNDIVSELPDQVYVSFDIDGLDPALCPSTGTPVAGGLTLSEVFYLFRTLVESGRKIVGFDVNEVSSGEKEDSEWDGNVGARVLYKLCGWTIKSNQ
ncbi:MAG: agmatinase family protein [Pseudobdellovibrionaceae bacterium]